MQYDHPSFPLQLLLRNVIFRGIGPDSPIFIGGGVALVVEHNLFYLPNSNAVLIHGETSYAAQEIGALGSGNLYGDPLFMVPAWGRQGDYRLQPGSPALGAGVSQGAPAEDLTGALRRNPPDIGVYNDKN